MEIGELWTIASEKMKQVRLRTMKKRAMRDDSARAFPLSLWERGNDGSLRYAAAATTTAARAFTARAHT